MPVLDATPAGRRVYRHAAFATRGLSRATWPTGSAARRGSRPRLREGDWQGLLALDREAFGGDREPLLRALATRLPARRWWSSATASCSAARVGGYAARAAGADDARRRSACSPAARAGAGAARRSLDHAALDLDGLALERPYTRMVHGPVRDSGSATGDARQVDLVPGRNSAKVTIRLIADGSGEGHRHAAPRRRHPRAPARARRAAELDERRQRALTRYYLDAGAGGLAVGVHTTQFAIREAGLFEPVLALAMEERATEADGLVMIAGLAGKTRAGGAEAELARGLGYHAGMLSLGAMKGASLDELIAHCPRRGCGDAARGLLPAARGRRHRAARRFWRRFAAIDNVVAIKIAPFDRYRTLDVVRGVVAARAEERVALYTGNDDHIVLDLPPSVKRDGQEVRVRIVGGLLGHWGVWTKSAVRALRTSAGRAGRCDLLALDSRVTDCNAAFFDPRHDFDGFIAGCHEVLRRQGLLEGTWCLDPNERLSPGQAEEIDRVCREHADLARRCVRARESRAVACLRNPERHAPDAFSTRRPRSSPATGWAARGWIGSPSAPGPTSECCTTTSATRRACSSPRWKSATPTSATPSAPQARAPRAARRARRLVEFTWNYFLEHPEFMTLLNSENLHQGRHVRRSRRVRDALARSSTRCATCCATARRRACSASGVDPVQLYISIAGEGYFYLSNRYTLSRIFDRDLMAPRALAGRARHNADMILNALRR